MKTSDSPIIEESEIERAIDTMDKARMRELLVARQMWEQYIALAVELGAKIKSLRADKNNAQAEADKQARFMSQILREAATGQMALDFDADIDGDEDEDDGDTGGDI